MTAESFKMSALNNQGEEDHEGEKVGKTKNRIVLGPGTQGREFQDPC